MIITTEYVEIEVGGSPMRMLVAAPKPEGRYPGVLFYSDIFQLTGPMRRASGKMPHAKGGIEVRLERKGEGGLSGEVTLPAGLHGEFRWGGRTVPLRPGRQRVSF